jgi:outer membrane protein TolC
MLKIVTLTLWMCLFSFGVYAQSNELDGMLKEIEKNNKELQTFSSLIESKQLELKSTNNLPDPQVSFFYLPFGNNNTGAYTEFQLSQSLDFPTVYRRRKDLITTQKEQLELDYSIKKQEVLLEAKKHYNKLIYLNQYMQVAQIRIKQASLVHTQVQKLFVKGQIGILESNKAKIVLLQEEFKLSSIENEIREILLLLKNLNGGKEISITSTDYSVSLEVMELENIEKEKEKVSPEYLLLKKMEDLAQKEIKLSQNMGLPNLTLGANYQGLMGDNYAGLYGGFSLPLWSNKNKVKAAKVNFTYQQALTNSEDVKNYSLLEKQYNEYQLNLIKYNQYLNAFDGLSSTNLLLKAYEMGQISFMEYYTEIKFYEHAEDEMLLIAYQLNQLKAEIFKFKL